MNNQFNEFNASLGESMEQTNANGLVNWPATGNTFSFEKKIDSDFPFMPKAVDRYSFRKRTYCDCHGTCDYYHDDAFFLRISSFEHTPQIKLFEYGYVVDRKKMMHRIGGPSRYELINGRIRKPEFYLFAEQLTEVDYWQALSEPGRVGDYFSFYESDCFFNGESLHKIMFTSNLPAPYCCYVKGQRMVYKVNSKRVNQSDFYINLEKRFDRIRLEREGL